MFLRTHYLAMVLAGAGLNTSPAASLFTDRDLFFEQNTRLATEDFSRPVNSIAFPGPLDASTGNAEINPGDIVNGLSVDTVPAFANNLFLGVPPAGGRTANTIGNNNQFSTLRFDFVALNVTAFGLDLYGIGGTTNISVDVFGTTGLVFSASIDMASAANPGFLGAVLEGDSVSRVELTRNDFNSFVNVYEIRIGQSGIFGASGFKMTQVSADPSPDTVLVRWTSENGLTYTLDRATASTGDAYVEITNGIAATPPLNNFTVNTTSFPYANFRVRAQTIP